jgi:hypothetical protein
VDDQRARLDAQAQHRATTPFSVGVAAVRSEILALLADHRAGHSGCSLTVEVNPTTAERGAPLAVWLQGDRAEVTVWAWGYEPVAEVVEVHAVSREQLRVENLPFETVSDFVRLVSTEIARCR